MDPEKVQAIQAWKDLTSVKELQQFLGFANFYRRFIQGYSAVVSPMTQLLRKEAPWVWGPEQAAAFRALKTAFTTAPVLAYYDYSKRTVVGTDASNWASGGVLSQTDADGKLRPVAFFSAKHSAPECNYEIYDKELLAIVKALEEWRPELQGTADAFEIITDHKNLQTFILVHPTIVLPGVTHDGTERGGVEWQRRTSSVRGSHHEGCLRCVESGM